MKKQFLLMGSLLLTSAVAFGGAFQLSLQGVRQLAQGGTGTAAAWDASSIFYNPGALSELKHIQGYVSVQALTPRTRYVETPSGTYSADAVTRTYTPFNVYVGGPVRYKSKLALGLGIYTPFGTGIKWDDNWKGRYVIQDIQMQTMFFQPTISYHINDVVSVGGGFIYATGNLTVRKAIPLQDSANRDGSAELKGDAHGVGYNLGIHLRATEWLQFGINYRSGVDMKVKRGYATFNVPASLSGQFPYSAFSSKVRLPRVITVGLAVRPTERLGIQVDASYVGWSSYDTLKFDYESHTPAVQDIHSPRRYKNTMILRLGANYKLGEKFVAMAGVAYDPSPVKDGYLSPDLPDADHINTSVGLTFKPIKRLTILGVLEYVFIPKRTGTVNESNFTGMYQTKVINPGLGITYDF
ncbi:MAG: outer membrane protein transport protein [Bacteroidetes bacterium]|nr:outer membrane protein transport protein [Bacteroidota bacterium]